MLLQRTTDFRSLKIFVISFFEMMTLPPGTATIQSIWTSNLFWIQVWYPYRLCNMFINFYNFVTLIYHYVADIWLSICIYVMRMGQTHHLTYPYSSCIKLTTHLNYIWSDTETYNYTSPEHILDLSTSFKDLSSSMPRNQWKWSSCPTNKKSHANSEPFFQPM